MLLTAITAAAAAGRAAASETDDGRAVDVHAGHRLIGDDNLFRLPDSVDPSALLGGDADGSERISTTYVSLAGRWQQSRQDVTLDVEAAGNRFRDYAELDNTSGRLGLGWQWSAGSRWSGRLGGQRRRTLGSFANTSVLERDIVDTAGYEGGLRFALGARWSAITDVRRTRTQHESAARRDDDVDVAFGRIGIELRTSSANTLAWTISESRAGFGARLASGLRTVSDYDERAADFSADYAFTSKLASRLRYGRLERTYPLAPTADFAGDTWNAALAWSPTVKTRVTLSGWQELRANLDADRQHFESTGAALAISWSPIGSVQVVAEASSETQQYLSAPAEPALTPMRRDEPVTRSLSFIYAPRDRYSVQLSYRSESRSSNRPRFAYAAGQIAIGVDLSF